MKIALQFRAGFVCACAFAASGASAGVRPGDAAARSQDDFAVAYQINPAHSGNINFSGGFKVPLKQIWTFDCLGYACSYAVVADNLVFVNTGNGTTLALELATGATAWSTRSGASLGPAYDRGAIFVINSNGQLSALGATTGQTLWTVQLPNQTYFSSPPMAVDGQVFTEGTGSGGDVYAVDESNGHLNWVQPVTGGGNSSPAYGEKGIYVSYPCAAYKFSPTTGNTDWQDSETCNQGQGNTPVFYSGRVYIEETSANDVLKARNGNLLGTFTDDIGQPAFYQPPKGKKLGFSIAFTLDAWDVSSRNNIWTFAGDQTLSAPPIVVNGLVFVGSCAGNVYAVDARTGTQEWTSGVPGCVTNLAAGEGILVVSEGGAITAFAPE